MKHLLLVLGLALATVSTISAQFVKHNDWKIDMKITESGVYATSIDGEIVSGNIKSGENDTTLLFFQTLKENVFSIRFILSAMPFSYDSSEEDRNYVTIETIIDNNKNTLKKYKGRIYNNSGHVEFVDGEGFDQVNNVYTDALKGNAIYVKISASSSAHVFKYSLKGFTKVDNIAETLLKEAENNNPFSTTGNSDNPF